MSSRLRRARTNRPVGVMGGDCFHSRSQLRLGKYISGAVKQRSTRCLAEGSGSPALILIELAPRHP